MLHSGRRPDANRTPVFAGTLNCSARFLLGSCRPAVELGFNTATLLRQLSGEGVVYLTETA
jgi:hypothetical protein